MPASAFAERYETTLVPVIFTPWARELIRRARPQDGEHILDLACGTGAVSCEILRSGLRPGSLAGADISAGMLSVARRNIAAAGWTPELAEGDAANLPFAEDRFDVAFCQQALQFFPDRVAALTELRRVLKPGGRVAFCVQRELEANPMLRAQAAALDAHVGRAAGDAVRAICGLPSASDIEAAFAAAGFSEIAVESVSLALGHPDGRAFATGAMGGMHTGDKLSTSDELQREKCVDSFLGGLGDLYDGEAIRFPHVSHVITARG